MSTYIALVHFTDQGIRHINQTTLRAKGLVQAAAKLGIQIKDIYWTMGPFDAVFTADAPDDESMTALTVSMASIGNIRTQTMRAFSAQQMDQILGRVSPATVNSSS